MLRPLTKLPLFFVTMLLCASTLCVAQQEEEPIIEPGLFSSRLENSLTVQPALRNLTGLSQYVQYTVEARKYSNGEVNVENDSGALEFKPNEFKRLKESSVILSGDDRLEFILNVFSEDSILLVSDTLTQTLQPKRVENKIPLAGPVITGLLVEQTRTKFGRDFFLFYSDIYNQAFKDNPDPVTIEEKPGIGRTTTILVKVGYETIYTNRTSPNQDYLKAIANQALRVTSAYLQEKKKTRDSYTIN